MAPREAASATTLLVPGGLRTRADRHGVGEVALREGGGDTAVSGGLLALRATGGGVGIGNGARMGMCIPTWYVPVSFVRRCHALTSLCACEHAAAPDSSQDCPVTAV